VARPAPPAVADDARPAVLVGLIGAGIQGSRTPAMHEREGALQGLRYLYQRIDLRALELGLEALPDLLRAAQWMGFAGLNITHPAKQAVLPLLDDLSDAARALGAVNTVVFEAGRRSGHNTDWRGFAESFRRNLDDVPRDRVALLGAGGGGAAVAYAALTLGVQRLAIVDLEPGRAERLAARLIERFGSGRAQAEPDPAAALAAADGLINATPVGMAEYPGLPLPAALLRPQLWVVDIVYVPLETELLRRARALGCRTQNGGDMAVFQAALAFRLFTGIVPDARRMRRHFAAMARTA
jgi:quinate/shikimate dehydrogenase (NAD+)